MKIDRVKEVVIHSFAAGWYRELDISLRDRQLYDLIRSVTPTFPFGTRALIKPSPIIADVSPLVVVALSATTIAPLLESNGYRITYDQFNIGSKAMKTMRVGRLFILPAAADFFLACLTAMEFGRAIVDKLGFDGIDPVKLGDLMLETMKSE